MSSILDAVRDATNEMEHSGPRSLAESTAMEKAILALRDVCESQQREIADMRGRLERLEAARV